MKMSKMHTSCLKEDQLAKLQENRASKAIALAALMLFSGMSGAAAKSKVSRLSPDEQFELAMQEIPDTYTQEDFKKIVDLYMSLGFSNDRMTANWDIRDMLKDMGKLQTNSSKSAGSGWRFNECLARRIVENALCGRSF